MNLIKSLLIFTLLAITAVLSIVMKPTLKEMDPSKIPDYEKLLPNQFENWQVNKKFLPDIIDPEMQASLDKIYSQTVTRTYFNTHGGNIMLSIAYGPNQSDELQVHKPEFCYPAQGFIVKNNEKKVVKTKYGEIQTTRLDTFQGNRKEFVTYWVLVGNKLVKSGLHRKMIQFEYGFNGIIPDGMLFRISSIGTNREKQYDFQIQFINDLLSSISPKNRILLIGEQQ